MIMLDLIDGIKSFDSCIEFRSSSLPSQVLLIWFSEL